MKSPDLVHSVKPEPNNGMHSPSTSWTQRRSFPEELVPVRPVGRMVLNRNPDNFFAKTEQVAFGAGNVVPGIDFSDDPLLAGRIHSYVDTQVSRLGGPSTRRRFPWVRATQPSS